MWLHHAAGSTYLQEEPCAGRSNLQERVVLAFLPSTWHDVLSSYMHAGVTVTVRVSELGLRAFRMYQAVDGLASTVEPCLVHGELGEFAFWIASTSSNLACAPSQWRVGCACAKDCESGQLGAQ